MSPAAYATLAVCFVGVTISALLGITRCEVCGERVRQRDKRAHLYWDHGDEVAE